MKTMRNFGDNADYGGNEETSDNYPAIERVLKLLRAKLSISTLIKSLDEPLETISKEFHENHNDANLSSIDSEQSVLKIAAEGSYHHQRLEFATKLDSSQSTINNGLNFDLKSLIDVDVNSIRDRAADILPAGRRKYFIARQLAYRSLQSFRPS